MKTKEIKIKGLANLAQLRIGGDATGFGKDGNPLPSREAAFEKMTSAGVAPAAKGYKGKSAFTRPVKVQEPTLEQVKAAIETADNQRSTKTLRKLQSELTEAKAKSVKEAARRQAQLDLVTIPAAFLGREGNLLSEAEVINRLGQPMRDHAKVIAAIKEELTNLSQLPSFKEQAKILAEFKKANGKPSEQLIAKAKANVAICNQAKAEVQSRLDAAYTEGDAIASQVEVQQAAAKVEYASMLDAADTALKGESLRDVAHAHKLALQGTTRHDESLALLTDAITRIEKGERLLQTALQKGSLEELLAMYAPEEVPIAHETDNIELAKAVAADPTRVLDMIDDYFLKEEDDKFVAKPGLEEFVSEKGSIFVTGEHAELILAEYNALIATAEPQLPNAKKERTKVPSKGTKVANAKPRKSKSA